MADHRNRLRLTEEKGELKHGTLANYEMKNNASTEYWNPVWMLEFRHSMPKCILAANLRCTQEDGSFSAVVLNLPGAGSCGDTEEDALNNARKPFAGLLNLTESQDEDIPWCDVNEAYTSQCNTEWIVVNV